MNYIILGSHADYCDIMCSDVMSMHNVYYENRKDFLKNGLLIFFRRIHLSYRINHFINLPFKKIWYKYYLDEKRINKVSKNVFIVFDSNINVYNYTYLKYLKNRYNGKLVLMLLNPMSGISTHNFSAFKANYDYIFTTDPNDSVKYDYIGLPGVYSKTDEISFATSNNKYDVFFIGVDKGRSKLLVEMDKVFRVTGIKAKMLLVGSKPFENSSENYSLLYEEERLPYMEVLKTVSETKCLLEVVQDGQSGLTLRAIEAIVYNKKLITNNREIMNSKFYNKKFMQVFDDEKDIDINFIKNDDVVDYGYKNEFSFINILDLIDELDK